MTEMSMNELEAIAAAENEEAARRIEEAERLLSSLPPKEVPGTSKWSRCIIVCNVCGCEETSAHVAMERRLWCARCGEMQCFELKFRLVR